MALDQSPIGNAIHAAISIGPRIVHAAAMAGHGSHDDQLRQLRVAQEHARELLTRLEVAELELAATPIAAPAEKVAA